ncbi:MULTISPECIES: membrane integrity-associated transporter subunit PqiC [Rahnella]|uniref:Membrane integrity-associated transporter subunit PqiC n=1 Tax=Rahnella laticis TaxID=2787622 RepID=A0ABS0E0S1_9GAMM|nr:MULTISPECIES: PqiC family protein [Rahnella]MBF7978677.1 membrane integrity-associated transporter subunit PqiC [Rahnella laticis]MBF7998767.1 membrane integrity-associated transporter subunit PqiC [Rahnella sp. LAC-M12]
MKLARTAYAALTLLILTGCASSAPHYYTLTTDAGTAPAAASAAPFVIRVKPVNVAERLNQPQLMVHQRNGELLMSDNALWAAPLPEEIRAALTARLERSLKTTDIRSLMQPAGKPVIGIRVSVEQFDVWQGEKATIAATWQLDHANESGQLTCQAQHQRAVNGGTQEQVMIRQKLVQDVADDIAFSVLQRRCG